MIFHIPIKSTFVSTTVPYEVSLYDENATYQDGDEVRKDDDIYTVKNVVNTNFDIFDLSIKYNIDDTVKYNATTYTKFNPDFTYSYYYYSTDAPDGARNSNPIDGTIQSILDGVSLGDWAGNTNSSVQSKQDPNAAYSKYTVVSFSNVDTSKMPLLTTADVTYTEYVDGTADTTIVSPSVPIYYNIDDVPSSGVLLYYLGQLMKTNANIDRTPNNGDKWYKHTFNSNELTYLRPSVRKIPFDTKQYTYVKVNSSQTWVVNCNYYCKSIALGRVVGDTAIVRFKDPGGNTLEEHSFDLRDNMVALPELDFATGQAISVSDNGTEPATIIAYSSVLYSAPQIEVEITGANTELGMIMPCLWLDVGNTDLQFSHSIKNYDKNFVSEVSGYIEHIKGNRIIQHKGSFHIEMKEYDKMVLLNKKLTQELVAIDGSDTVNNEPSDGIGRFASTKLICRVKQLSMLSKVKDDDIMQYVPISFEFEEVV